MPPPAAPLTQPKVAGKLELAWICRPFDGPGTSDHVIPFDFRPAVKIQLAGIQQSTFHSLPAFEPISLQFLQAYVELSLGPDDVGPVPMQNAFGFSGADLAARLGFLLEPRSPVVVNSIHLSISEQMTVVFETQALSIQQPPLEPLSAGDGTLGSYAFLLDEQARVAVIPFLQPGSTVTVSVNLQKPPGAMVAEQARAAIVVLKDRPPTLSSPLGN